MALVYFGLSVINLPILVWKKRKQTVERLQTHDSFDSMEEEEDSFNESYYDEYENRRQKG